MFEISVCGFFEDIENKINTYETLEKWDYPPDEAITYIKQADQDIWISRHDVGAICIDCALRIIYEHPSKEINIKYFKTYVTDAWLPFAYQLCGVQVMHASAVVNLDTLCMVAFCGESGSGKSTLAYGLAKRDGWKQIADDCIAFGVEAEKISFVHLPNIIKLRSPSAEYFEALPFENKSCSWVQPPVPLKYIFFLGAGTKEPKSKTNPILIEPVSQVDSYELMIKQAFSITTKFVENNKKLVESYLALARNVQSYRLSVPDNLDYLEETYDAIEDILK